MHSSIQWPHSDHYMCATCGRLYPVPWANAGNIALAAAGVKSVGVSPQQNEA